MKMVCHLFDHMCSCFGSNSAASVSLQSIIESDRNFAFLINFGSTPAAWVPGGDCGSEKKSCPLFEGLWFPINTLGCWLLYVLFPSHHHVSVLVRFYVHAVSTLDLILFRLII